MQRHDVYFAARESDILSIFEYARHFADGSHSSLGISDFSQAHCLASFSLLLRARFRLFGVAARLYYLKMLSSAAFP